MWCFCRKSSNHSQHQSPSSRFRFIVQKSHGPDCPEAGTRGQCVLNVKLHPFAFTWSDVFTKPQESHHLIFEVTLIAVSQLPVKLVQVSIRGHGFDLTDKALSLFHRDPRASDVPSDPPAFQFDTGGNKGIRHHMGSKVARATTAASRSCHCTRCASIVSAFMPTTSSLSRAMSRLCLVSCVRIHHTDCNNHQSIAV